MRVVWSLVLMLCASSAAWAQTLSIDPWTGNGYIQSQLVRYKGTIFFCTGGPAYPPGNICPPGIAPDSAPNGGVWNSLSGLNQWRSDITYQPNDLTVQSGQLYTAIVANTNKDPAGGAHPEAWAFHGVSSVPIYNVQSFGATGTGCPNTNDTPAFLAAIAAATAAPGPSRGVYVPAGTYCITSTLTVAKNFMSIFGDGASSILQGSGVSTLLQLNADAGNGPYGMEIHHLAFQGASVGIGVNSPSSNNGRSKFTHLYFSNTVTSAIVVTGNFTWNLFSAINTDGVTNGILFQGSGAAGPPGAGTGNVFSSSNLQLGGGGVGIEFAGASDIGDITFDGIQFGMGISSVGIRLASGASYKERVMITNCQFDGGTGVGMDIQNYGDVTIMGVSTGGAVTNNLTGTTGAISMIGALVNPAENGIKFKNMKTTGAAGKKVVCFDTTTGELFASTTGTDCSN